MFQGGVSVGVLLAVFSVPRQKKRKVKEIELSEKKKKQLAAASAAVLPHSDNGMI